MPPRQGRVRMAAFDLTAPTDRGRAAALLLRWTAAAERLARGEAPDPRAEPPGTRAAETGVLAGTDPARLTLTFGLGTGFVERPGLTAARPEALAPLPAFPNDQLEPRQQWWAPARTDRIRRSLRHRARPSHPATPGPRVPR
ncbi:Dyp-type peroxidase domain-containing protein [Streptomyces sp. NPDC058548]|uniref:Dyp-type peroxidase domain-containing protein n=1 Tax=unclassified Streptomyces TaxID=2593676 RepID=UPI003648532F